jgi:lipoate-protein ligase A
MDRWYCIEDGPSSGAANMARDEFLLARVKRLGGPPVLRLYSFEPPAVTIGYHQDPARILNLELLRRDGIDVVRRITGGRALLHAGELTYSVVVAQDHRLCRGGLSKTYLAIARGLTAALRRIGVDALVSNGAWERKGDALVSPCLFSVSRHEITAGGKKICASAQRRTSGALIQHGSIFLAPGSERIVRYTAGNWDALGERMTTVTAEAGREVGVGEMKGALREAFAECFGVEYVPLVLSPSEARAIELHARDKGNELSPPAGEVAGRC